MGHGLVQVLEEFAHAGHGDAERLHEQQQLLGLQVLQGCGRATQRAACNPGPRGGRGPARGPQRAPAQRTASSSLAPSKAAWGPVACSLWPLGSRLPRIADSTLGLMRNADPWEHTLRCAAQATPPLTKLPPKRPCPAQLHCLPGPAPTALALAFTLQMPAPPRPYPSSHRLPTPDREGSRQGAPPEPGTQCPENSWRRRPSAPCARAQPAVPASTSRGTSERIMRSFSQSGSSSASSDVSTRKAVGSGFFSGNQMSSRAWNSPSPASGETTG